MAICATIPVSRIEETITPRGIFCFILCRIDTVTRDSVAIIEPLNVVFRLIILLEWLASALTVA